MCYNTLVQNRIERGLSPRPDLEFWESGKAHAIKRGFAIVTLRKPGTEFDYSPGDRIMAFCRNDNEKIPVVILNSSSSPLTDFPAPVLALDNYFSAEDAAKDLRQYPGYEETTASTQMQAFTFISAEAFDKLSDSEKKKLISSPTTELLKDEDYRHLFLPAICYSLSSRGGNIFDWLRFLEQNNILDEWDVAKIVDYDIKKMQRLENGKKLNELSTNQASPLFKPFILGIYWSD